MSAPAPALVPRDIASLAFSPLDGAQLPLDVPFVDERGAGVTLADYVRERPAIVVLGWYGCSDLCSVVLRAVDAGLRDAGLVPGRDVEIVVASIAPLETPTLAREREAAVLGRADVRGWHFLTGREQSIDAITASLGYRAAYDPASRGYAHATGITIVRTGGTIASMLPGVVFDGPALQAAVRQAQAAPLLMPAHAATAPQSAARWLLCFHDDLVAGVHDGAVLGGMRVTGIGSALALAALAWSSTRRARRRRLP